MDSSCCPKDSFPYLQADHKVQGEYLSAPFLAGTEKDDEKAVDFFAVGKVEKGGKAIVFIGDVWGWNTGRIRPIAEFFAQQGYYCVVPKLLVPALEGGCDGDGLPPNFEMGKRGGDFVAWIKTIPFEGAVKPRMAAVLAYLKGEEVSKIGMVGYVAAARTLLGWFVDTLAGVAFVCPRIVACCLFS